jgi:predicted ribosomally synthesized peptide with SipW-like signal peptide
MSFPPHRTSDDGATGDRPPSSGHTMTDDGLVLSRRRLLAALGSVAGASVGAGLGTSAYLSDEETFANDRLTAGSLDLKVDWQEHYVDRSAGEGTGLDVRGSLDGVDSEAYRAFPPGRDETDEALLWVHETDVPAFMRSTSIEGLPDVDDDGVASFPLDDDREPCAVLADVGADDAGLASDARTRGTVRGRTTGPGDPLVDLADVKPGDFGEVIFSAHLCGNDGYLWLTGGRREAAENGTTEPEAGDPDEGAGVELLDAVRTALWYDADCDNLVDATTGPVDVVVAADISGSIETAERDRLVGAANAFVESLPTDDSVRAGLLTFGAGTVTITDTLGPVEQFLAADGSGELGRRLTDFGGNSPVPAALRAAAAELDAGGRPEAEGIVLLVTDGGPNYDPDATYTVTTSDGPATVGPFSGGRTAPSGDVSRAEIDETVGIARAVEAEGPEILTAGVLDEDEDDGVDGSPVALNAVLRSIAGREADFYNTEFGPDLVETAELIAGRIAAGDEVVLRGTLRETLAALSTGRGVPLDGDRSTPVDETAGPSDDPARDCFDASATHCVGLSWWLPAETGNEVQTDRVAFDVGFYAEQCRHNDGGGADTATAPDA